MVKGLENMKCEQKQMAKGDLAATKLRVWRGQNWSPVAMDLS